VERAAAGKPSKDSGTSHEQQYVRQVIELHDKYLAYVSTCFANSSLFHKALKEAFEGFCNKNVAGSTSAELMANFCDNLLKKVTDLLADGLTDGLTDTPTADALANALTSLLPIMVFKYVVL
jgi:hypothetical protein